MGETIKELDSRIKEVGLKTLQDDSDLKIVNMWLSLSNDDLAKAFVPSAHSLSSFIQKLRESPLNFYTTDKMAQIDILFWGSPASDCRNEESIFGGLWIKKEIRGTKKALITVNLIYEVLFLRYNLCLGNTWQPQLHKALNELGYKLHGILPSLYGISNVHLIGLSKQDFYESKLHNAAVRLERSKK